MAEAVKVEKSVAASPESVYDLVSDVTRMGEWSPETTSCRWLGGVAAPVVGARFRGSNRRGWRRWSTTCTVAAADRGRRFAFDVAFGPLPIARWTYEFAAEGDGCRVTESFVDRRPSWMVMMDPTIMGIGDRGQHNRETMEATLASLDRYVTSEAAT
ncbi:MAG TPA: SRPBCC family protein [Acidimicrobiales bacterium]|nr:SRPBCC family protein [Acidimicrobiales bacterium]